MLNLVEKFTPEAVEATDEDGVVAIEYVMLAAGVVVAVVAVVTLLQTELPAKLTTTLGKIV
jgi:Flp pilus assembly pilin Flp